MWYRIVDKENRNSTLGTRMGLGNSLGLALEAACDYARPDNEVEILAVLAKTETLVREDGAVLGGRVVQLAAAIPLDVLRRAIDIVEPQDTVLALLLRGALMAPES